MKKLSTLFLAFISTSITLLAQVDEKLKEDIRNTGYLHNSPLPLDHSKSFETFGLTKKVLRSDLYQDMESLEGWSHKGIGGVALTDERSKSGNKSLRLSAPTTYPQFLGWGLGFGTSLASFDVGGQNWEKYNRIHLYIYPNCEGDRSIYLNLYVENDGEIKVPDKYGREGYHEINLINGQWNEVFVEMTELPRDKVSKLKFAIEVFGKELTMGETLNFDIDAVSLQTIENPEVVSGWQPAQDRIVHSTTGYRPQSNKSAIVRVKDHNRKFHLLDNATNRVVHEGVVDKKKTPIGSFETVDFSDFKQEGQYVLRVVDVTTKPFYIHQDVWEDSAWRVLNFIFCERCGYPVPGKHGACHADLNGTYNGKVFPANGGWHDAADMSQQTLQTGELVYSLMEMAKRAKEKKNKQLYLRMMEEA
ncbi:MAG: cellulase N-terminal Ig-like domain-containing protein, partial [Allomuricauda sp.]